jgi:hypothetical protein
MFKYYFIVVNTLIASFLSIAVNAGQISDESITYRVSVPPSISENDRYIVYVSSTQYSGDLIHIYDIQNDTTQTVNGNEITYDYDRWGWGSGGVEYYGTWDGTSFKSVPYSTSDVGNVYTAKGDNNEDQVFFVDNSGAISQVSDSQITYGVVYPPSISNDGKFITYISSPRYSEDQIVVYQRETNQHHQVSDDSVTYITTFPPIISSNGEYIVYISTPQHGEDQVFLDMNPLFNKEVNDTIDIKPSDLLTYSVISGGAVNIAAQPDYLTAPNVGGHLAGQAAVVIGAFTTVNDIYAGAAVTTGASSRVKQIHAGAAAGVGANAYAQDVDAGAAVVVGAGGAVGDIIAGAAITLGAGATYYSTPIDAVVTEGAGSMDVSPENGGYTDDGVIVIAADMNAAMEAINAKVVDNPVDVNEVETYTDLSGLTIGVEGGETTVYYSAITLQADSTLYVEGNVTVITSESMTVGAGANIELVNGATVTWILGGSLNLGAGSKFSGETYVNGAVNGATSDVACGNLYATGAVSIRTIGHLCAGGASGGYTPKWHHVGSPAQI